MPFAHRLGRLSAVRIAAASTFATSLAVYLVTMNRTIGFIDRGELAAVAWTFGIPHATGYPTLMLLAGALAHLAPLRPVLTLNLLAAVLTAAGAGVLTLLVDRVIREVDQATAPRVRAAIAAATALVTAFTVTWWQQANGFEVYALHTLMMPLVVLLAFAWLDAATADAPGRIERASARAGFAFALALGLSLTNHMTTALLVPGLALFAAARLRSSRTRLRRAALLAPGVVVGVLPYAWLPIRAAMHPRFDWGAPTTASALLHHVTGGDYRPRMFADAGAAALQARYLLWHVPLEFAWVGLILVVLGTLALARRAPATAVLAASFVAAGSAFAIGYRIPDIDAYLLTTVFGLALALGAGLAVACARAGPRWAIGITLALVVVTAGGHWRDCDERKNDLVERYVHDLLGPLPRAAVLFSDDWDIGEAATYYYQEVERYRADVTVVSPNLCLVGWYLDELEGRRPELVARAHPAFARYREVVRACDRGVRCVPVEVAGARAAFLSALVTGSRSDRAVFTTTPMPDVRPDLDRVPWHLVQWLGPASPYAAETPMPLAFRRWDGRVDPSAARLSRVYAEARLERARYEAAHGRPQAARTIAQGLAAFDPGIRPAEVQPFPLGADATVLETVRFFRTLERETAIAARR